MLEPCPELLIMPIHRLWLPITLAGCTASDPTEATEPTDTTAATSPTDTTGDTADGSTTPDHTGPPT